MKSITAETKVARATQTLATELDDETILMSIERGAYYGMEQTARRIWQLLDEPRSVAELCRQLTDEYQVDAEVCRTDLTAFLEELLSEGLIVVA